MSTLCACVCMCLQEGASQLNPHDDGAAGKAGQGTGGSPPNTGKFGHHHHLELRESSNQV
jgi:hypothetical protein